MKKLFLVFNFLLPALLIHAQSDTLKTKNAPETTCKITIGGLPTGSVIDLQTLLSAKGIAFADTAKCKMIIFNFKMGGFHGDPREWILISHAAFTEPVYQLFKAMKPGDSFTIFDVVVKPKGKKMQTLAGGKFTVKK